MSNPNSKVTLRLSPKRKHSRVNEPLDVGSPTPFGFTRKKRLILFHSFLKLNTWLSGTINSKKAKIKYLIK